MKKILCFVMVVVACLQATIAFGAASGNPYQTPSPHGRSGDEDDDVSTAGSVSMVPSGDITRFPDTAEWVFQRGVVKKSSLWLSSTVSGSDLAKALLNPQESVENKKKWAAGLWCKKYVKKLYLSGDVDAAHPRFFVINALKNYQDSVRGGLPSVVDSGVLDTASGFELGKPKGKESDPRTFFRYNSVWYVIENGQCFRYRARLLNQELTKEELTKLSGAIALESSFMCGDSVTEALKCTVQQAKISLSEKKELIESIDQAELTPPKESQKGLTGEAGTPGGALDPAPPNLEHLSPMPSSPSPPALCQLVANQPLAQPFDRPLVPLAAGDPSLAAPEPAMPEPAAAEPTHSTLTPAQPQVGRQRFSPLAILSTGSIAMVSALALDAMVRKERSLLVRGVLRGKVWARRLWLWITGQNDVKPAITAAEVRQLAKKLAEEYAV